MAQYFKFKISISDWIAYLSNENPSESYNGIQTVPDEATHIKLSREYAFELRIRLYLAIFNLKLSKDYNFPGKNS